MGFYFMLKYHRKLLFTICHVLIEGARSPSTLRRLAPPSSSSLSGSGDSFWKKNKTSSDQSLIVSIEYLVVRSL